MSIDLTPLTEENPERFWIIGRKHYKVVKFVFEKQAYEGALMLAQQSFELYIKGILSLNDISFQRIHVLIDCLELGKDTIPEFKYLLTTPSLNKILKTLGDNFLNIRYGKTAGTIGDGFFNELDKINEILDKCFFETMKRNNPDIFYKNWTYEEYKLNCNKKITLLKKLISLLKFKKK